MILVVDASITKNSRTRELTNTLLNRLNGEKEVLVLDDLQIPKTTLDLLQKRTEARINNNHDDECFALAKQFASADTIVICAPYWDLSFPALLKDYLEKVCVTDVTFHYGENGMPMGLCKAKRLYYITTSGGPYVCPQFGFGYVETLAKGMFGIPDVQCFYAENLDIYGANVEKIMADAKQKIEEAIL